MLKSITVNPIFGLYGSAISLWLLLAVPQSFYYPGTLHAHMPLILCLFGLSFLGLVAAMLKVPWEHHVYLIAAFVPFEFSATLPRLPTISPIDYFCAALVPVSLFRLKNDFFPELIAGLTRSGIFLWAGFFAWAFFDAWLTQGSLRPPLRWGEFLFCYFIGTIGSSRQPLLSDRLARILIISATLMAVVALCQFFSNHENYMLVGGTFRHHNSLAAFLNFGLPVSLLAPTLFGFPILGPSLSGLIAVALIASCSRGAWVGLAIGLGAFWLKFKTRIQLSRRTFLQILIACCCGAVILSMTIKHAHRSWSGRDMFIRAGIQIISDHPWRGLGPGNYARDLSHYLSGESLFVYKNDPVSWMHLHNLYLQLLVDYGLAGGVLILSALGGMVLKAWRSYDKYPTGPYWMVSVIAFLVHNLVDITTVNSFDLLFAFILAALTFSKIPREV